MWLSKKAYSKLRAINEWILEVSIACFCVVKNINVHMGPCNSQSNRISFNKKVFENLYGKLYKDGFDFKI
jgi:hypothetical protein